ncbi:hypothetical protein BKA70DRAFT_1234744 [Coprinopsis sp. MPI-PUGE-AT-0042]|nr:hypothetical protein BKA70DRAFT_1234744 [Coprinopsis sp. MPI-PUGE-AT-0042]
MISGGQGIEGMGEPAGNLEDDIASMVVNALPSAHRLFNGPNQVPTVPESPSKESPLAKKGRAGQPRGSLNKKTIEAMAMTTRMATRRTPANPPAPSAAPSTSAAAKRTSPADGAEGSGRHTKRPKKSIAKVDVGIMAGDNGNKGEEDEEDKDYDEDEDLLVYQLYIQLSESAGTASKKNPEQCLNFHLANWALETPKEAKQKPLIDEEQREATGRMHLSLLGMQPPLKPEELWDTGNGDYVPQPYDHDSEISRMPEPTAERSARSQIDTMNKFSREHKDKPMERYSEDNFPSQFPCKRVLKRVIILGEHVALDRLYIWVFLLVINPALLFFGGGGQSRGLPGLQWQASRVVPPAPLHPLWATYLARKEAGVDPNTPPNSAYFDVKCALKPRAASTAGIGSDGVPNNENGPPPGARGPPLGPMGVWISSYDGQWLLFPLRSPSYALWLLSASASHATTPFQ